MKIAVPKEMLSGEGRVAATPDTVRRMVARNWRVAVESGAGAGAHWTDAAYREAGAEIAAGPSALYDGADVVLKVKQPVMHPATGESETEFLREGQTLVAFLHPAAPGNHGMVRRLAARGVLSLTLDCVPRISRAQPLDALTSMSTVAGYKSALKAANRLECFVPMIGTAVGAIPPAKALVVGTGVAGLQAVATLKRLGASIQAADIRPAAVEQAGSLGAKVLDLGIPPDQAVGEGGYARALDEQWLVRERAALAAPVAEADIVILAALVPGRRAPCLLTAEMVAGMKPGSVIVDVAIDQGGELRADARGGARTVIGGVAIDGTPNLPGAIAGQLDAAVRGECVPLSGSSAGLRATRPERRTAGAMRGDAGGSHRPRRDDSGDGGGAPMTPLLLLLVFVVAAGLGYRWLGEVPPAAAHAAHVGHERALGDHGGGSAERRGCGQRFPLAGAGGRSPGGGERGGRPARHRPHAAALPQGTRRGAPAGGCAMNLWEAAASVGLIAVFLAGIRLLRSPRSARVGNLLSGAGPTGGGGLDDGARGGCSAAGRSGRRSQSARWRGLWLAARAVMIGMPQLVALLNGLGGGASALVAVASLDGTAPGPGAGLAAALGAATLAGSLLAAAKLAGGLPSRPLSLPGGRRTNGALLALTLGAALCVPFVPLAQTAWLGWAAAVLGTAFGVGGDHAGRRGRHASDDLAAELDLRSRGRPGRLCGRELASRRHRRDRRRGRPDAHPGPWAAP